MKVFILNVIFVMILVMYSEAGTLNLTYTPNQALENSLVALKCSYTGLKTNETVKLVTWNVKAPNETTYITERVFMPGCSVIGYFYPERYSLSCGVGYFEWNMFNVSRNDDQHIWTCTLVTTERVYVANTTLNVHVPITAVNMTVPTYFTVTMNAGDSETFKCRTSGGLPQATIKWFKVTGNTCSQSGTELTSSVSNTSVSVVDGLREVESTLTFNATDTDNGRRICCTAINVAGIQRMSGTKLLDVRYAPTGPPVIEMYASGSTYSMIENNTETLTCSSTGGNPLATLTWNCFNGQMFSPTVQSSTVKRVFHWTARRNENARCTCTASHVTRPNQSQSAFVNVNILYPPSTPLFRVTNTYVGSNIRVVNNSTQTVECNSSGNPSPTSSDFKWRRGTNAISSDSFLSWPGGVKVDDEGSYTCTVKTNLTPTDQRKGAQVATRSSTVEITVLYPPGLPTLRLDSTSGPVISGSLTLVVQRPFTLACNAFSKPPANYTWTGGVHIVQGQLLQDTLTANVNTTRTCIARNYLNPSVGPSTTRSSSATVTININYPPERVSIRHESKSGTDIHSELRVIEGYATKLFCSVQSQPVSSFTWSGAGFLSRNSYLVHNNTLRSQTGILSCLAENNMTHGYHVVKGSASRNISLNVLYPPKLQALPRRNVLEGNRILIQCSYTVGNPITTKSTITRTTDGHRWSGASHTFQSINRTDAGLYRCNIENSMDPTGAEMRAGSDTADFEINVWYKPSISRFEVSAFPNQNIVTINESERLIIVCEVTSNPNSTIRLKQTHMTIALMERDNVLGLEYAIQNASCSDAAVYTCAAFNKYTDMERAPSKEMQLLVRCSPRPSDNLKHLRRNFTGIVHGNVIFSFMAVAYPPPMFEWQKWNGTSYNRVNGEKSNITSSDLFTSLTVLDIQVDDFVSYILKVSNGIQPYLREVFHLNPQDVPQCPTDFTLLSKSTGIATVQWKRAFNGGLQQTFVLVYKKSSNSKYFTISEPEDKETAIYNTELSYLEAGQLYDVILYSQNVIGPCRENRSLKIELDAEDTPPALAPVIGGVVGGGLGAAVAVVAIVFILRRKYTLNCSMSLSKKKDVPPGQNGDSTDNPGYDAAEMYEQVQAKKETPVYDDLNDGNDGPDHSHLYTPLEESNPRSSIHYENVKREDPIYHNMVM